MRRNEPRILIYGFLEWILPFWTDADFAKVLRNPETRRLIMINGINCYNNYMSCLQTAKSRPDPTELFNNIDTDSSGGISQSELDTFVQAMSSQTGQSINTTDAVSTYDVNGDGELSQDELKSFMDANGIAPPPPPGGGGGMMSGVGSSDASSTTNAESIISQYDTNGDGVLSSDELQGYLDNSDTTSLNTLMQHALSAYMMNFDNRASSTNLEDVLTNYGGLNGYSSVDLTT
jgi:Ca2+-binding EF-hand superfamily protein